jgi:hypothetical protein
MVIFAAGLPLGQQAQQSKDEELPAGEGRTILLAACTSCHDLKEVTKFKGYYDLDDWRDVVTTMVAYGAKLDDAQSATLAEYLAKNLGRQSNEVSR